MVDHAPDETDPDGHGTPPDLDGAPLETVDLTPEEQEAAMIERGRKLFAATARFFFAAQRLDQLRLRTSKLWIPSIYWLWVSEAR